LQSYAALAVVARRARPPVAVATASAIAAVIAAGLFRLAELNQRAHALIEHIRIHPVRRDT
jgi:hypothetical protein